jgi:hypothetical protein
MALWTNSKGKTVDSPYTGRQAIDILKDKCKGSTFAMDLVAQHGSGKRGLTDRQWPWVHTLAVEAMEREAARAKISNTEETTVGEMTGILDLFAKAKQHLQFPKIRLHLQGLGEIRLSVAGARARFPGSINVVDGNKNWLGRVQLNGKYEGVKRDGLLALLQMFAKDPVTVAKEYAAWCSSCCFCGLELTDPRSVAVSYGPICADHYGLPWGEVSEQEQETHQQMPAVDELPLQESTAHI